MCLASTGVNAPETMFPNSGCVRSNFLEADFWPGRHDDWPSSGLLVIWEVAMESQKLAFSPGEHLIISGIADRTFGQCFCCESRALERQIAAPFCGS